MRVSECYMQSAKWYFVESQKLIGRRAAFMEHHGWIALFLWAQEKELEERFD